MHPVVDDNHADVSTLFIANNSGDLAQPKEGASNRPRAGAEGAECTGKEQKPRRLDCLLLRPSTKELFCVPYSTHVDDPDQQQQRIITAVLTHFHV